MGFGGKGKGKGFFGFFRPHVPGLGLVAAGAAAGAVTAAAVSSSPRPRVVEREVIVVDGRRSEASTTTGRTSVTAVPVQQTPVVVRGSISQRRGKGTGKVAVAEEIVVPIASVSLPPEGMLQTGNDTTFTIYVVPSLDAPWTVSRNYAQFRDFQHRLGHAADNFSYVPFPQLYQSGRRVDPLEIRHGLEAWLREVLRQVSNGVVHWSQPLHEFLVCGRDVVGTTEGAFQTKSESQAPVAGPEAETLEVVVPAGACAGTVLEITSPTTGDKLHFTVPNGTVAGMTILLCREPGSSTATVVDA